LANPGRPIPLEDLLAVYRHRRVAILFILGQVVQAAGGEPRRLFKREAATRELEGEWSPDGSQIVFGVFMPGWDHDELWIAAADGTHERTLWVGDHSGANTPHWGS